MQYDRRDNNIEKSIKLKLTIPHAIYTECSCSLLMIWVKISKATAGWNAGCPTVSVRVEDDGD